MISDAQNKNYSEEAESVANAIGRELNSQLDGLTEVAISGGQSALEDEINSIVQTTATAQMQSVMQNVSVKFAGEFSKEFESLSETFANFGNPNAMTRIQSSAEKLFDTGKASIDAFIKDKKGKTDSKTISTILGIIGIATDFIAPILEVVITLLPMVLSTIFEKYQEQKQRTEVRGKIAAQIPSIKRSVREKVSAILKENAGQIIQQISEKFDEQLKAKEEEINTAIKEMENIADIEQKIASYQGALNSVDELLNKVL